MIWAILKPLPLKKDFLNQNAKAVSVKMRQVRKKKWPPPSLSPLTQFLHFLSPPFCFPLLPFCFFEKLVALLPSFWKFCATFLVQNWVTGRDSENALEIIKFTFWFLVWSSFIRCFNLGIFFVLFSLHISRGEKYISLDSNFTLIVIKFRHIRDVISFPQLPSNTKIFSHRVLAKCLS